MFSVLRDKRGFSLIELMVVVAIIAILSTIAIPGYQTFQAKARQKEGFGLLSAYYQAAQAARAEYGFFPGDFVGTGFAPTGTLKYHVAVADDARALPYGQRQDATCVNTNAACTCGNACARFKEWIMAPTGSAGVIGPVLPTTAVATQNGGTNASFTAAAAGWISNRAATSDEYTIDQQKRLVMRRDGTK